MARQDVIDEVLYLRSAGLDLSKRFLLVCVRVPNPKRQVTWSLETERFGTTPAEVRRLLAWLTDRRVELVAMEATSDYWRPVYYTLQDSLNLMLVNPAHLKGIRGRKSDPNDAAFLARAGVSGMVMASFVPPRAIRDLRDLTRRRTEVVVARGQEAQRLEKKFVGPIAHRTATTPPVSFSSPGVVDVPTISRIDAAVLGLHVAAGDPTLDELAGETAIPSLRESDRLG